MTHESILEKYRAGELERSLKGVLAGVPVTLVVNSALLIGLVSIGRGVPLIETPEPVLEIIVTDVEEVKPELEEPVVEPPPPIEPVAVPETAPIVAENPPPKPEPPAPKIQQPEPKITPQPSPKALPAPSTLSNLLQEVIPNSGATESKDGDTETPASAGSGSSFAPGSGTGAVKEDGNRTSEFADRIRGLLKGSGAPTGGNPKAALPEPPPPPVQNRSRFGCVQCEKPSFPSGAKEKGIQGEAKVSVDVDANGNVTGVRLINSSGHPELDQAAIEQAKRWRFTPSEGGKQGVSARVDFQIEGTDYQRQSQERQRQREAVRQRQQGEQQERQATPAPVPERPVTTAPSVPEPIAPPPPRSVEPPAYEPPPPVYEPPAPVAAPPPPVYEPPAYTPTPVYEAPVYEPPPPPPVYEPPPPPPIEGGSS